MANDTGKVDDGARRNVSAMASRARHEIEDAADRAKRTVDDLDRKLVSAIQERPLVVLGVAVGVGYVIGRLFSRIR